mmetsp:Transcript_460/g.829  ORF Transcript_460/g.829 Transcript_460/m.829 type:complete len:265 (-) Transcript_460:82-876(-)
MPAGFGGRGRELQVRKARGRAEPGQLPALPLWRADCPGHRRRLRRQRPLGCRLGRPLRARLHARGAREAAGGGRQVCLRGALQRGAASPQAPQLRGRRRHHRERQHAFPRGCGPWSAQRGLGLGRRLQVRPRRDMCGHGRRRSLQQHSLWAVLARGRRPHHGRRPPRLLGPRGQEPRGGAAPGEPRGAWARQLPHSGDKVHHVRQHGCFRALLHRRRLGADRDPGGHRLRGQGREVRRPRRDGGAGATVADEVPRRARRQRRDL